MPDHSKNRRRAERLEANLFVDLVDSRTRASIGRGVVIDVSIGGLAIETEMDLDRGREYECHIEIPFSIPAKVVRRMSEGQLKRYGLQMLRQGFFDKLLLRKVLKGRRRTAKV